MSDPRDDFHPFQLYQIPAFFARGYREFIHIFLLNRGDRWQFSPHAVPVECRILPSYAVAICSCYGIIISLCVVLNRLMFVFLYPFWNVFRHCFLFVYKLLLQCAHFVWYNGVTRAREPTETESRRYGSPKRDSDKNMAKGGKRRLINGNPPALSRKKGSVKVQPKVAVSRQVRPKYGRGPYLSETTRSNFKRYLCRRRAAEWRLL